MTFRDKQDRLYQRVGFKLLHTFQEYDFED